MSNVRCIYCGESIPEHMENCPHCNSPSHFQVMGKNSRTQKRFIRYFILLVVFLAIMIIWLPR